MSTACYIRLVETAVALERANEARDLLASDIVLAAAGVPVEWTKHPDYQAACIAAKEALEAYARALLEARIDTGFL